MKTLCDRKVSMKLKRIFLLGTILTILLPGTIFSQEAYWGVIQLNAISICGPPCGQFYLEPDSGYASTWLAGNLGGYVGLHVEVIGNIRVHCVEGCTALQVSQIRMQEFLNVRERWNIVSVPFIVGDYTKTTIFPTALSAAFAYYAGYIQEDTLSAGQGYWLKFDSAQTVSLIASVIAIDSINVVDGWNLIGSISYPVATQNVTSDQPGMITSDFYGYKNGYFIADTIQPGKGYWVKLRGAGSLIVSSSQSILSSNRIRIVPTSDLPPPPPGDVFAGSREIPRNYSLSQNYPNPFNPTTRIEYALPMGGYVTLKLFDMLGSEVAILFDGYQDAGYKYVEFDSNRLGSGVYFCRLQVGNSSPSSARWFSDVKKLIVIK